MRGLQQEQFRHDERFHREIARLSVHARLNHMALHFCKYTGQLASVCASGDAALRQQTVTDSFIISLCTANTLNLDIGNRIAPSLGSTATIKDIGIHLHEASRDNADKNDNWLFLRHAIYAAQLARACEKIDHLEAFDFRKEIEQAVAKLCETVLIFAANNNIDLIGSVRARRSEVRARANFVNGLTEIA